jgi:aspartate/methionine/tyrosine aminotransferase
MTLTVPLAARAEALVARGYPELTGSENLDPIPESAVRATLEALSRGETHYTDRPGILPLREAVSAWLLERFGIITDPKANTVITCGVTEARFVAVQELLSREQGLYAGDHAERLEGALVIRGAGLAKTLGEARVLYLTSSMPEDVQRGLLEPLNGDAVVLFEVDEATSTFHPAQLEAFRDRTVSIGDLCLHEGLQSWRVGFLAAPPASAAGLRDFKQALTICTTNLSQWAALALMEEA